MGTVGEYLVDRLSKAGLKHVFGVPGDYVLDLFECLEKSGIETVGNCNELNAGYAADAYARLNGVGAICVTYGVGGFSLFNAVVGAYAERLPMIVISGSPKALERTEHHLLHHTIGDMDLQYKIYEKVTVVSTVLSSPDQAPRQIDEAITACLRFRRPVYIEVPMDIVRKPCREPGKFNIDTTIPSDRDALVEAVEEATVMLEAAKKPVIIAGVEAHRLDARDELQELVDRAGYPFAVTLLGKSIIPEQHPQFVGVYGGIASWEGAKRTVEDADVILSLGTLMTDIYLGGRHTVLENSRMIVANSDNVRIKHHVYNNVSLKDFIECLSARISTKKSIISEECRPSKATSEAFTVIPDQKISIKRFYQRINRFLDKSHIILADAGDSLFSASNLFLPKDTQFIDQAFYLSIGYSVPATLGVKLAAPGRRSITFVGDGAFQMTMQEVSTIARHGLNPIIFLMNNDGYTIERVMVDGKFNDIHMWKYHKVPELFGGGWGSEVKTEGDLEEALLKTEERPDELAFIEICLDKWDCSDNLRKLGEGYKGLNKGSKP